MKKTLTLKNVSVAVDGKEIVSSATFSLPAGKIFVLMGHNGSGKSSLAMAIAGHPRYKITRGTVKIGSKNILKLKPEERAHAGLHVAMQSPPEIAGVPVANFLRLAKDTLEGRMVPRLALKRELEGTVDTMRLAPAFLERGLYEGFSGGEKKRLELLEFSVLKPKFAVFDEIDSGLDVDGVRLAAEEITKAKNAGAGILIITHGTRLLKYLTPDAVMVMKKGKIVKRGSGDLAEQIERHGY